MWVGAIARRRTLAVSLPVSAWLGSLLDCGRSLDGSPLGTAFNVMTVLKIVAMLRRGELQAAGVGEQVGDAGAWVMRTAASAAAYSLTVIVVTIIFSNIATRIALATLGSMLVAPSWAWASPSSSFFSSPSPVTCTNVDFRRLAGVLFFCPFQ